MREDNENIDQLFKETLGNFEAEVNPSVWENIEQGLQASSSGVDNTIRPDRIFSKMKLKNIISLFLLSGAAILAILYFTGKKKEKPLNTDGVRTVQQNPSQYVQDAEHKVSSSVPLVQQMKAGNTFEEKRNGKPKNQISLTTPKVSTDVDHSKEDISVKSPTSAVVKVSKEKEPARDKNLPVKSNSEPLENVETSKTAENNDDAVIINSTGDDAVNEQNEKSPVFSTDNGFAFYIPKVFTPNGDGLNDYFTPMGLNFKDYELKIFDRLGLEIFSSKEISILWDGKLKNGEEAARDMYLYVINVKDLNNENHQYKGRISLMR